MPNMDEPTLRLYRASYHDNPAEMAKAIQAGADREYNAADANVIKLEGVSAHMNMAINHGSIRAVRFLVGMGARIPSDEKSASDFWRRIYGGNFVAPHKDKLADIFIDLVPCDNEGGKWALNYFINHGDVAMARRFLELGAKISTHMQSSMSKAIDSGSPEMVRLVAGNGGNIDDPDERNRMLLATFRSRDPELVKTVMDLSEDMYTAQEFVRMAAEFIERNSAVRNLAPNEMSRVVEIEKVAKARAAAAKL